MDNPSQATGIISKLTLKARSFANSKAFTAMFWVLLGNGGYQFIRLLSNLILTRLLFPEAFGVMAIVNAILVGLAQISDVGLREGVVNSDKVNDPAFMRTAWTMQVMQYSIIALLTLVLAAPAAAFYNEPILLPVMAFTAITMLTTGFKSIALLLCDKNLDLKTQIIANLSGQVISLIIIIAWAWVWPSIWALVVGHFVASILDVAFSYLFFKGHFSKFTWHKPTAKGLFHFGKWILLSSTISYITIQGDKLIMGSFITMAELGLYSIATTWAALTTLVSYDFSKRVLHPYFRDSFDRNIGFGPVRNMRLLLNSCYLMVCIPLCVFGDLLIQFLYDDRYLEAGWMLQILVIGQIGRSMSGTLMPFLLAKGDSRSQMTASISSAILLVVLIILGGSYYGSVGVIIGYSLTGILTHPIMVYLSARHGYNCSLDDFILIFLCLIIIAGGWFVVDASVMEVLNSLMI